MLSFTLRIIPYEQLVQSEVLHFACFHRRLSASKLPFANVELRARHVTAPRPILSSRTTFDSNNHGSLTIQESSPYRNINYLQNSPASILFDYIRRDASIACTPSSDHASLIPSGEMSPSSYASAGEPATPRPQRLWRWRWESGLRATATAGSKPLGRPGASGSTTGCGRTRLGLESNQGC